MVIPWLLQGYNALMMVHTSICLMKSKVEKWEKWEKDQTQDATDLTD